MLLLLVRLTDADTMPMVHITKPFSTLAFMPLRLVSSPGNADRSGTWKPQVQVMRQKDPSPRGGL